MKKHKAIAFISAISMLMIVMTACGSPSNHKEEQNSLWDIKEMVGITEKDTQDEQPEGEYSDERLAAGLTLDELYDYMENERQETYLMAVKKGDLFIPLTDKAYVVSLAYSTAFIEMKGTIIPYENYYFPELSISQGDQLIYISTGYVPYDVAQLPPVSTWWYYVGDDPLRHSYPDLINGEDAHSFEAANVHAVKYAHIYSSGYDFHVLCGKPGDIFTLSTYSGTVLEEEEYQVDSTMVVTDISEVNIQYLDELAMDTIATQEGYFIYQLRSEEVGLCALYENGKAFDNSGDYCRFMKIVE